MTTELRVDNTDRSYAYSYQCSYPINIDVDQLTYLKLNRKACVKPTVVSLNMLANNVSKNTCDRNRNNFEFMKVKHRLGASTAKVF